LRLDHVPIPPDAQERAWRVVAQAFEERVPSPRPSRRWPAVAAVALVLALAAAALSPPGRAVLGSVREALGVKHAAVALVRLPAPGRLLVNSSAGPWIVGADGSKRRLGGYRDASWSPHGLFEVVTSGHELAAVDPKGKVRWSLERRGPITGARWSGDGFRIAYLSGSTLRVVAGDGTGDRVLARDVAPVAPAWYGVSHQLGYADPRGRIHLVDVDGGRKLWVSAPGPVPTAIGWDARGRVLVEATSTRLRVLHYRDGQLFGTIPVGPGPHLLALSPLGPAAVTAQTQILLVHPEHPWLAPRQIFHGSGAFDDLTWSADGRWLVASWGAADQWVFLRLGTRSGAVQRVQAVSSIARQFHARGGLTFGGWCCAAGPPSR
jgi:hypothetical protein